MHHSDGDALWVLSIKGDPQDVARLQKIVCQALQDARNAMDGTKPCGGCGDQ